jgi:hypothetical protein
MTRAIAGIDSGIEEAPQPVEGEGSERLFSAEARRAQHPGDHTIPNYNRKTDRLQFGTLIGITSEW